MIMANARIPVNVGDVVYVNNYIFREAQCDPPGVMVGCPPACQAEGDANKDGGVNVGDVVYVNNYIFREASCDPPSVMTGCPPECGPGK